MTDLHLSNYVFHGTITDMNGLSSIIPDKAAMALQYARHKASYEQALASLVAEINEILRSRGIRPTIKSRVKDFESLYAKKIRLLKKAWDTSTEPLPINDTLAMRIICPFLGDLEQVEMALSDRYTILEIERKGQDRSFREFGYESIHVLIAIPESIRPLCTDLERDVVEIQLRTILQEAWAEVEHELVYKAEFTPFDEPLKRKLAALNATLTLSDIIFQEILEYQKKLNEALGRRREEFYRTIEARTSEVFQLPLATARGDTLSQSFVTAEGNSTPAKQNGSLADKDLDSLLLAALNAHNASDFERAVAIYAEILSRKPDPHVAAVVYKHKGMAHFAQADYEHALADFTSCVMLDPECYKAYYYRGVVKGILGDLKASIDDFTRALEIHPYHFYSRYRRALSWWKLGDYVQAHEDCTLALRIDPENRLARELQAAIREKMAKDEI